MTLGVIGSLDAQPYSDLYPPGCCVVAQEWTKMVTPEMGVDEVRGSAKRNGTSLSLRSVSTRSLSTRRSKAESVISAYSESCASVRSFSEQPRSRRSSCLGSLERIQPKEPLQRSASVQSEREMGAGSDCSSIPAGACWPQSRGGIFWKEEEAAGNVTNKLAIESRLERAREARWRASIASRSPQRDLRPACGLPSTKLACLARPNRGKRPAPSYAPEEPQLQRLPTESASERSKSADSPAGLCTLASVHPTCRFYVCGSDDRKKPDPQTYGHETCIWGASWAALQPPPGKHPDMGDEGPRSPSPQRVAESRRYGPRRLKEGWEKDCAGAPQRVWAPLMVPMTPCRHAEKSGSDLLAFGLEFMQSKKRDAGTRNTWRSDPITFLTEDPRWERLKRTEGKARTTDSLERSYENAAGLRSDVQLHGNPKLIEHDFSLTPPSCPEYNVCNLNEIGWEHEPWYDEDGASDAYYVDSPRSVATSVHSPSQGRSLSRSRRSRSRRRSLERHRAAPSELMRTPRSHDDSQYSQSGVSGVSIASQPSYQGTELFRSDRRPTPTASGHAPRSTPAARRQRRLEAARTGGLGSSTASGASSVVSLPSRASYAAGNRAKTSSASSSKWKP